MYNCMYVPYRDLYIGIYLHYTLNLYLYVYIMLYTYKSHMRNSVYVCTSLSMITPSVCVSITHPGMKLKFTPYGPVDRYGVGGGGLHSFPLPTHTLTHTYTHTYMHTHPQTHTYIHTHTSRRSMISRHADTLSFACSGSTGRFISLMA